MQHEYTAQQLDHAMGASHDITGDNDILEVSFEGIRAFLDALPDQPGPEEHPHPEIEFDEVRKGDRIDVLTIYGNREILTVEARTDCHLLAMGTQIPAMNYIQSIRLIDRPAVHPDPEEHPVIANVAVHKPGTNSTHRYDYATWDVGEYYDCWSNDGKYYGAWPPSAVVEWSPAKVVADND